MPPLARMLVPALADLASQLRFAPREALLRDIDRAEALAAEIDPEGAYGEAWIIARVTGYAPRLDAPATVVGAALLADLSAFVERLCDAARLTDADLPPHTLDHAALEARWNVSRKTIDRYRKQGLVARRVTGVGAHAHLAFTPAVIAAFETRRKAALDRASRFSRIDPSIEARIIRRAARYRRRFGCTLNEAAARLARRFSRSHEAIRQVIRRHDHAQPPSARLFTDPGPPDERFERLAWRAWRRALDPALLATRTRRSRVAITRAVNHHRARLLKDLADSLPAPHPPPPRLDHDAILSCPPATTALGSTGLTDPLAWLASARATGAVVGVEERLRAQAYHLLIARAARIARDLSSTTPEADALDHAETLLRWAIRLKAELVRAHLGLLVRTAESRLGRPLDELRAADLADLIRVGTRALADAVDPYDPFADALTTPRAPAKPAGRLAAPAGFAADRAVLRWMKEHPALAQSSPTARNAHPSTPTNPAHPRARALPRLTPGLSIPDWTRTLSPWQAWLEPNPRVRPASLLLDPTQRHILERRFAWDGQPPATLAALATQLRLTRIRVVVQERNALRAALDADRTWTPPPA